MKYSMNLMTANPFSPSPGTTATAQFQKQPLLQTSLFGLFDACQFTRLRLITRQQKVSNWRLLPRLAIATLQFLEIGDDFRRREHPVAVRSPEVEFNPAIIFKLPVFPIQLAVFDFFERQHNVHELLQVGLNHQLIRRQPCSLFVLELFNRRQHFQFATANQGAVFAVRRQS